MRDTVKHREGSMTAILTTLQEDVVGEEDSLLAQVRRAVSSSGSGPESREPELHHLAARLLLLARRGEDVAVTERDEAAVSGDLVDIS